MRDVCSECGDLKIQNRDGVCLNRHGCEHRQFQHRAAVARLSAEMDRQAWHNEAREHARRNHPSQQWVDEGAGDYDPASSLLNFWKHGNPERTNHWINRWLSSPEIDDEDE